MKKMSVIAAAVAVLMIVGCGGENGGEPQPSGMEQAETAVTEFTPQDLMQWRFLGTGTRGVNEENNALYFAETEGSVGVTLVSPEMYGPDLVLSFRVMPLTFDTVNVVMTNASDADTGDLVSIPEEYDGGFGFWTEGNVQSYLFAFHNEAHNAMPSIRKTPGLVMIDQADVQVDGEEWHDVELGREGAEVWMTVDGNEIARGTDPAGPGLPAGQVCFRLRGTADGLASCLIKDVTIR